MKIVFLDSATLGESVDYSAIEQFGELKLYPHTSIEEVNERVSKARVVIVNKVKMYKEQIDAAPLLKLICVAATGTNNVDTEYAKSKGVEVKNVVAYSTESVVQITFGSILALLNHTQYFDNIVKSGEYSKSPHFTDTGRSFSEIAYKKFGIIGMGTIGKRVAEVASAFGAKIMYYSTSGVPHFKKYPAVTLEELLSTSDIISIHSPLNDKTKNLISMKEIRLMKPDAIIVNMGRGGIVNEQDLAKAIDFDLIAGASTDVYEQEPIPADHPFLCVKNREKLILTPHIGWSGETAKKRLLEGIAANIEKFSGVSLF
ncbi:MAG: D-2-hydroxyacid dehydrogenase [Bacteroidales bacterium]|jgi:glycerate dehydrogenase|nr:D-2-hydroxyacid dehydrogenase [Bacteroidales bacterium]